MLLYEKFSVEFYALFVAGLVLLGLLAKFSKIEKSDRRVLAEVLGGVVGAWHSCLASQEASLRLTAG
ncbi:hypothetical protein [Thermococcus sp. JCM 11816]|uniref:hypothetical protein n=1 Tax=Thermococcus sp. (strain JCM 11816 / KS-1) TaxID=1295125 RepID=UPI000A967A63